MPSAASPGRSTSNVEPILIFDLDGTVLTVNSFPYWVKSMLFSRVGVRAALILVQRKLLGHSHADAKQAFQELWATTLGRDQQTLGKLIENLRRYVRPNLVPLLTRPDAILATSAASEYALSLGERLGFRHILTTRVDGEENSRENKRDRVLALLAAHGWSGRRRVFFTDHEEDLPLIKQCQRTLWFGDNRKIATLQAQAPHTQIIACTHLLDVEVMELIR